MNPKRILTPAELAMVCEMQDQSIGLTRIARQLKCGREVIQRELDAIGRRIHIAKRGGNNNPDGIHVGTCVDPTTNAPIGKVPPGHPLYEVDQAAIRARTQRASYAGWRQSSLADV